MINFLPLLALWMNEAQIYKQDLGAPFLLDKKRIIEGKLKSDIYGGSTAYSNAQFSAGCCQTFLRFLS